MMMKKIFQRLGRNNIDGGSGLKILKKGHAMRIIFFYPGEEGTYVDNAKVTLFENGIVHIESKTEVTTTHLQNCEILWQFESETDDRASKLQLLRPTDRPNDGKPAPRGPELR